MAFKFNTLVKPNYKITKPIRLIELFAGIGAQAKALERLKANFEHYRICEFDKYAVDSYNAVHGTNFETSDITKIRGVDLGITNTDKYDYIMTYSFPCQSLSKAGLKHGMEKGSGTRSGLLWEVERLLKELTEKPQILIMENVCQVHSEKNLDAFNDWISCLENMGYRNYYKDLNSKNYGMAQSRDRCFMVSVLGDYNYSFPTEKRLDKLLKDYLEDDPDEKYDLKTLKDFFIKNSFKQESRGNGFRFEPHVNKNASIAKTITTRAGGRMDDNYIIYIDSDKPKFKFDSKNKDYADKVFDIDNARIRKLTPKECWRLMGFLDEDFDKAEKVNSVTQLYQQAGNSIVVEVLMEIFKQFL